MFCIVETKQQLDNLINRKLNSIYIKPIEGNFNYHPKFNTLVGVYIRELYDNQGYFLCINHNDTLSLDIYDVFNFLNDIQTVYTDNYKHLLYFFNLNKPKIVDINENFTKEINYISFNTYFDFYYNNHKLNINLNSIIPVLKLYEWCDNNFIKLKQYCYNSEKYVYNRISKIFYLIEQNGLQLEKNALEQLKISNPEFFIDSSNKIYSYYNLYTQTGRPSNSFNGFNFMAINKENGNRKQFIPSNDLLIEIDFTAYHPYLIANILQFEFNNTPYIDFANEFNLEISNAKNIMFQNLYGGIQEKYKDFEFFNNIDELSNILFSKYESEKGLINKISKFNFNKEKYPGLTKNKVLNYFIQNLETYKNIVLIQKIIQILTNTESKIIHYTYDAILFDFSKNDINLLEKITDFLESKNLHFKIYKGKNYQKMNKVYEI